MSASVRDVTAVLEQASTVRDEDFVCPAEFSDEALALAFADRHVNDLRYVATWNKWLHWTGVCWQSDVTMLAFDHARHVCRTFSERALLELDGRAAKQIGAALASAKTVAAVERLAKADRRLAATVEQWDSDLWILNTPAGVVDLRTGTLRENRPTDFCTKAAAVAPSSTEECPTWFEFLARITDGDVDLVAFLKRMAGYMLTGLTKEHCLFFAFGTGRNGKSVFANTLSRMMGDYATVAGMETFTHSSQNQHPTDLAMLRGARLVTAQETESDRRWAESKIKGMTGGDPITARFMRQDFFTFEPQFKLLIGGNHKPALRGVDEAIRARFNLLPFTVTIPRHERDLDLSEKLKAEWPGILRWAINGCLDWRRLGLERPSRVLEATDQYLAEQDIFQDWLDERCEPSRTGWESSARLFDSWKAWAERRGEHVGTQKRFSQTLQGHGFVSVRNNTQRGFTGLRLRPVENSDAS